MKMKKIKILLLLLSPIVSQAQLNDLIKTVNEKTTTITKYTGNVDISSGLKEALNKGISEQVSKLTAVDGFYKNEAVKILMPAELAKVDKTLRKMGLSKLADEGVLLLTNLTIFHFAKTFDGIFRNARLIVLALFSDQFPRWKRML